MTNCPYQCYCYHKLRIKTLFYRHLRLCILGNPDVMHFVSLHPGMLDEVKPNAPRMEIMVCIAYMKTPIKSALADVSSGARDLYYDLTLYLHSVAISEFPKWQTLFHLQKNTFKICII